MAETQTYVYWGIAAILAFFLVSLIYTVNQAKKECKINKDCSGNQYCGSDFKCHDAPVVEKEITKEVVKYEQSYVAASAILAAGLIIAALIYKGKVLRS